MESKHGDNWGWMLAVDFFFAGMGGAAVATAGILDFAGLGLTSAAAGFAGAVCIGIGALLLILELGKPLRAWRVFTNPKAVLTFGAWNMTLAAGLGFAFGTFALPFAPWAGVIALKKIVAGLGVITGLIVAAYPGVLLARHKARPFWHGPGIIALFLTSSLVTGLSLHLLCHALLPAANPVLMGPLSIAAVILLALQLVFWLGYILVKRSAGTEYEAAAAERLVSGDLAAGFLAYLAGGTLLPLLLIGQASPVLTALGALLTVGGGALMRLLTIKAGEYRTWLPGEQSFRARLARGDEAFMTAWAQ
ncbi:MAG: polysulfide reductase NrfD [Gracilibacteraceae bacterium]|jgi:formate-dependent nitrite reductase membrane component NrfD|nr:polysulfide reductase NrfD [Gracilibacteraceae bacterium]